jgi:hypothetical protein
MWVMLCLFIAGLFFLILLAAYVAIVNVAPPKNPRHFFVGDESKQDIHHAPIPKIIWAYWHQESMPDLVRRCINNWQEMAPDHEIRVLHQDTLPLWLGDNPIPDYVARQTIVRQSDWLRLQLLAKYGGIWMDASIILTQSLAWVHEQQQQKNVEFVGFYLDEFTYLKQQPMVECWFMAVVPNSPLIQAIEIKFNEALKMGDKAYLQQLKLQARYEQVVQKIKPGLREYLMVNVVFSDVLDQGENKYRLSLTCAEDSAFTYHSHVKWNSKKLFIKLALSFCPSRLPVMIKFIGADRRKFDRYLARKWFLSSSFLVRFLKLK